jgi:lysozyme
VGLREQLIAFEGWKNEAYPDPLTGAEPWTIGVGHTGPEVFEGLVWSDEMIDKTLYADIAEKTEQCRSHFPWIDVLNEARQAVVIGMCFQMGIAGLSKFVNTMQAVKEGRYEDAADGMLASRWAKQTPGRAEKLAKQMESGVFA